MEPSEYQAILVKIVLLIDGSDISPEHIGSSLLQDGLLMVVEQVAGVEHVKEVELGVDRDGRLHPGLVRSCALLYHQLLKRLQLHSFRNLQSIS